MLAWFYQENLSHISLQCLTDTRYQRLFWENCYKLQNINDTNRNVLFFYLNFATYAPSGLFAACIRRSISRSKIRRTQIRLWSSDAIPHMCFGGREKWMRKRKIERESERERDRKKTRVWMLVWHCCRVSRKITISCKSGHGPKHLRFGALVPGY